MTILGLWFFTSMSEGYILKQAEKSLPLKWYYDQSQFDLEVSKIY